MRRLRSTFKTKRPAVAAEEGHLGQGREERALLADPRHAPGRPAAGRPRGGRPRARSRRRRASGSRRSRRGRAATTSGRAFSECGATNVIAIASRPQTSTGPAVREVVARRAGRRRADDAVAAAPAELLAADRPLELDHPADDGARDDEVVDRDAPLVAHLDVERRQLLRPRSRRRRRARAPTRARRAGSRRGSRRGRS